MASRGLRKIQFFSIWRPVRGETLIFVCFYGCVVFPLKPVSISWMEGADVVTPGLTRPPDPLYIRKNTQKSKFLFSQTLKWKKNMFFKIPEIPSKTLVMGKKKLPDHFKNHLSNVWGNGIKSTGPDNVDTVLQCLFNEWMKERMNGWMNLWMHGWINGWINQ